MPFVKVNAKKGYTIQWTFSNGIYMKSVFVNYPTFAYKQEFTKLFLDKLLLKIKCVITLVKIIIKVIRMSVQPFKYAAK